VAWGFFLLWVGIALLADVGWGAGLVGAAVIVLAAQAYRRHVRVAVDRFSLALGVVFAGVGLWSLLGVRFGVRVELAPLLFIAAGLAVLASAWRRHRRVRDVDAPAHPRA
jgi:hypothetical protein